MYSFQVGDTIESRPIEELTSPHLASKREEVATARKEIQLAEARVRTARQELAALDAKLEKEEGRRVLRSLFEKRRSNLADEAHRLQMELVGLEEALDGALSFSKPPVGDFGTDRWSKVASAFGELVTCDRAWDITSRLDGKQYRSTATSVINREVIRLGFREISEFDPDGLALYVNNANGPDLYVYPGLLVAFDHADRFALIDCNEVVVEYTRQRFIEDEQLPSDTRVVDFTYKYANNDGTPDMRFNGNHQIPIALYGKIKFRTSSGLNEEFMFSNAAAAESFVSAFNLGRKAQKIGRHSRRDTDFAPPSRPVSDSGGDTVSKDIKDAFDVLKEQAIALENTKETLVGMDIEAESVGLWGEVMTTTGSTTLTGSVIEYTMAMFYSVIASDGNVCQREVDVFAESIGLESDKIKRLFDNPDNATLFSQIISSPPEFIKAAVKLDKFAGLTTSNSMANLVLALGKAMAHADSRIDEREVEVLSIVGDVFNSYLRSQGIKANIS